MLQNDLKKQTMSTKSKNSISVKSAAKKEQFETKDSGKSKIADSSSKLDNTNEKAADGKDSKEEVSHSERYLKPLFYNGTQIRNHSDLLDHLDLNLLNKESVRKANKEYNIDDMFLKLTKRVKPDIKFYEQSMGDRLLYIDMVDRLTYDIVEENKLRK
jgi:hypothetical protein|tara:strand:+ start:506 stop:979 length:474 start_codon:yes stop_codon:yes gene_type:complete